jgi:hypothetical protein
MPIPLHSRRTVVSGLVKRFAYAKTGPKKKTSKEGTFGDSLAELTPPKVQQWKLSFVASEKELPFTAKPYRQKFSVARHLECPDTSD